MELRKRGKQAARKIRFSSARGKKISEFVLGILSLKWLLALD
jgi:hypothetical protein